MQVCRTRINMSSSWRFLLAALLWAGDGVAADDSLRQPFPDHGACDFFEPLNDLRLHTKADDYKSMVRQSQLQQWVVDRLPKSRLPRIPVTPRRIAPGSSDSSCSGIDDCIKSVADAAGIPFAALASDEEFLRRARLDLTGRIPTVDEVLAFLSDGSADKRAKLVDRLLKTPEWADRWTMFFGDMLQNTVKTMMFHRYSQGRDALHLYLLESMQQNKPYDQMVRELLAAEGPTDGRDHPDSYADFAVYKKLYRDYERNPVRASPVSYVAGGFTRGGPREDTYDALASMTSRHFLGISAMECVLCHDGAGHLDSLSVWGTRALRLQGWNLASYFARMSGPRKLKSKFLPLKKNGKNRYGVQYYIVRDLPEGTQGEDEETGYYRAQSQGGNRPDRTHHEQYVAASYPFDSLEAVSSDLRLREQLGFHITSDPQFARAAVNYVWAEFFSRGIVEPADEFDPDRLTASDALPSGWDVQPSHPALLEWLAQGFVDSGFDLKWLMREIVNSETYQLSSRYDGVYSPSYDRFFVRHSIAPLTAEQIVDAIAVASGVPAEYQISSFLPTPTVSYAMQFPDVRNMPKIRSDNTRDSSVVQLLDAFNRGNRDDVDRSRSVSPLQAMHLMNNPWVLERISFDHPRGTLFAALSLPDHALVSQLYLSVLSRMPTETERLVATDALQGGDRGSKASELMWVLFNKTDFYFNY